MRELLVRAYSVRFGDAILIAIPDEDENGHEVTRHVLIDLGNVLGGEGGQDDVFGPVVDDLIAILAGQPLDLYVMTHEHLDHVQGLPYASARLGKRLTAQRAWLTASADPGYYDRFPDASRRKIAALAAYRAARSSLRAAAVDDPFVNVLLANNDATSTAKSVAFLRALAPPEAVKYVHRGSDIDQPFRRARIAIWAPEEDTSDYYGRFGGGGTPLAAATDADAGDAADDGSADVPPALPLPPRGVDAGAFYDLIDIRQSRDGSTLLAIDKASNNTSVVLCIEWEGWRLLFPGDAEKRSWRTMDGAGVIGPVHFLKVSHHGSHTGLPPVAILDRLLPVPPPDARPRSAVVSTYPGAFPGVPDPETLATIAARCELRSTADLGPDERWIDLRFPADASRSATGEQR